MAHNDTATRVMGPVFDAMRGFEPDAVRAELAKAAPAAVFRMCHPFGTLKGADAYCDAVLLPLAQAMQDLRRQEVIRIAGRDQDGAMWVGSCGAYTGKWVQDWLGIPATGCFATMRFHEFYRIERGACVEMQAVWEIPEMMMQADLWPMVPQLGRFQHAPAPMTQDGRGPHAAALTEASRQHVIDMLTAMIRHPLQGGPEVMELERYWHPQFMWYGPCGIGTACGIEEFRRCHQIPFLNAMPDRGQYPEKTTHHVMAEGAYVGVTGWPDMCQTLSGDGWLGLPPLGRQITLRSLDFWRLENGKIRENWVLVDLLDIYAQIGVDVFARMEELKWSRGYR
ncbi:ester cyclase [Marivita sp. S0852]|uniref:nuclear transport factor 2 family protein n=1 Tax=Marivita sp. S0852 TaxID=3373893 RepID=UPI003981E272